MWSHVIPQDTYAVKQIVNSKKPLNSFSSRAEIIRQSWGYHKDMPQFHQPSYQGLQFDEAIEKIFRHQHNDLGY